MTPDSVNSCILPQSRLRSNCSIESESFRAGPAPGGLEWLHTWQWHSQMDTPSCHLNISNTQGLFLQWDEFCDLLGGAAWTDACGQWSFEDLTPERRQLLPVLASRFADQRQFLFSDTKGSVFPLEAFWLKWRLFAGLCSQVLALHRDRRRPHLGLHPSQIQITIPEVADPLLPARWNFAVKLLNSEGAMPFVHEQMPPAFMDRLFQPPHSVENPYQATELRDWPLGKSEPVTILVRSMERVRLPEVEGDEIRGMVQLHILTDSIPASAFSEKDVFHVHLNLSHGGASTVRVWGSKVESAERGLVISGVTEPMRPALWDHLEQNQKQVFSQSKAVFYRAFQVPCDLYSLGVILLRTLVGQRAESTSRLELALPQILVNLEKIVTSGGSHDPAQLSQRIQGLLNEEGALFSQRSLLFPTTISPTGATTIPDELWYDGVQLAFRFMGRIPGFGFSANSGDYDVGNPGQLMEHALKEVMRIGEWIYVELFGSRQRNRDILTACQILREELVQKRQG